MDQGTGKSRLLLDYVRGLEGLNGRERRERLLSILESVGLRPSIQKLTLPHIQNYILDFGGAQQRRRLLFSAHYDAVPSSPGANDNASGVAVLLGLCLKLKDSGAPVRAVFFDREEAWLRTRWIRLGLLGSIFFVMNQDLRTIEAVYNLEFCGRGDTLTVWPVRESRREDPAFQRLERTARGLNVPLRFADLPWWVISSDHLPFRLRGVRSSASLSLLPAGDFSRLQDFAAGLSLPEALFGARRRIPGTLSVLHSAKDTSADLNEESLQLMLSILLGLIEDFEGSSDRRGDEHESKRVDIRPTS